MTPSRRVVLGGLLAAVAVAAALALTEVLPTVFFAITVAYVLFPLRQRLVRHGLSRRAASAVATTVAFVAVVVLLAPLAYVLYRRRAGLLAALARLPDRVPIAVGEARYVVETAPIVDAAEVWLRRLAIEVAAAAPVLVLLLAVFTLLVYGILYRPLALRRVTFGLVPPAYHDVVTRLHEQTRSTLLAIYVLQATTSVATFLLALVVFRVLGYDAPLSLAVIAGILQFVPIVGPSILVIALAIGDVLTGMALRAIAVLALGLFFVGFVPDAVIRTRLAGWAGNLPSSLYFVGFVGGALTLGAIGVIVGPLVVALLMEVVGLLSEGDAPAQA